MAHGTGEQRCSYVLDPEEWRDTHQESCHLNPLEDEDILTDRDGTLVWECPHPTEDGEDKCLFHLPEADRPDDADAVAEFVAVVNDDESHDDAADRPPRFIGARFEHFDVECDTLGATEDIDLRHVHAETFDWAGATVTVGLDASGLRVDGRTELTGTTFESDVALLGAKFHGVAKFRDTTVESLNGRGMTCERDADFHGMTVTGDLQLPGATFEDAVNVLDLTVTGTASLNGATFEDGLNCQQATFESRASFRKATFESRSSFNDATFAGEADFREATFEFPIFIGTTFAGSVRFEDAQFVGEADFRTATFEDDVDCQQATFREGKFQDATFHEEADFSEATFEWARFADATFNGAVTFENAGFRYLDMADAVFHESVSFQTRLAEQVVAMSPFQGEADFAGITVRGELDVRILDREDSVVAGGLPTFTGRVDFIDAELDDADFEGVSFEKQCGLTDDDPSVTFADADLSGASLRDAQCSGVEFTDADLTNTTCTGADFSAANLEGAILSRANLYEVDFTNTRLYGTIFGDARISDGTTFLESGSRWTWLPRWTKGMQTVVYDPRTDPVVGEAGTDNGIDAYTQAASVYTQLETLATANAASDLASTCFRWRKDMQRKRYWNTESGGEDGGRQWIRYALSKLTNVGTRYGDSPWRVVGWSVVVMAVSTLLFWLMDGVASAQTDGVSTPEWLTPIYFSLVTFTTLGYGDFQPATTCAQLLASVESLLGALLLALLIAVLGRRATR